jgi:excisionase family DNA binding protein
MASLMTETEVAKRLNVSLALVRRWRVKKHGPAFVKVGVLVRYRPEDLEAWLNGLPAGGSSPERFKARFEVAP